MVFYKKKGGPVFIAVEKEKIRIWLEIFPALPESSISFFELSGKINSPFYTPSGG